MKKMIKLLLSIIGILSISLLIACENEIGGNKPNENHTTHDYVIQKFNEKQHWMECSCGAKSNEEDHTFSDWTIILPSEETTKASKERECIVCHYKETIDIDELSFELNSDKESYSVIGKGSINSDTIIIPNLYRDKPVTSIESDAFAGCEDLLSIIIPNSITRIEDSAFSGCHKLVEIYNLSNLNIKIGSKEYGYIGYYAKGIHTSLKESSGLIKKGNYTFYKDEKNKYYLVSYTGTQLVLPDNIEGNTYEINAYAFENSYDLTSIRIPNSVTNIGESAFFNCNSLTSITIPNSVTTIGTRAFSSCSSLTSINIPNSVTNIGSEAFSSCSNLTSVTIPNSVTDIGDYAFSNCSALTSITIPNSVTSIGDYAFSYCSSLTSITIPDSVTDIGKRAFSNCSSLTNMEIPNNLTDIGEEIVSSCSKLIYNEYENGYYLGNSENPYVLLMKVKDESITSCKIHENTRNIYQRVFFNFNKLTSIELPQTITSIGDRAFFGCSSLSNITIPKSVVSIGESAFTGCNNIADVYYEGNIEQWCKFNCSIFSNLSSFSLFNTNHFYLRDTNNEWKEVKSIKIPYGITEIGVNQFAGFNSITSLLIPNSVKKIGSYPFIGCSSLADVYYEGTIEDWFNLNYTPSLFSSSSDKKINHFYCKNTNDEWEEVTSINIPNGVTEIGNFQFSSLNNVSSISIPNSVKKIGEHAFSSCTSLTDVYYEGTIEDWFNLGYNDSLFSSFGNEKNHHFYCKNKNEDWEEVTSIKIPNWVTEIGVNQFSGFNNVTSISIPSSVKKIGSYPFAGCYSLANVYYEGTIEDWFNLGYVDSLFSTFSDEKINHFYCKNMNKEWEEVINIEIPNGVTEIRMNQFLGLNNVASISIPNSVKKIEKSAFAGCSSITHIYYEGTIEDWFSLDLDESLFLSSSDEKIHHFYCKSTNNAWEEVTSIEIPNGVTEIRMNQFKGFSNVQSISIPDGVTRINFSAFAGCSGLESIIIPSSIISIEEYAFLGCNSLSEVYFHGTSMDWNRILFGNIGFNIDSATIYYYSETEPLQTGNYWHYDDIGNVVIW